MNDEELRTYITAERARLERALAHKRELPASTNAEVRMGRATFIATYERSLALLALAEKGLAADEISDAAHGMANQIAKLEQFKVFVHHRLDAAGIPTDPDGPHSKEGCRIGDRLDIALKPPTIDRDEIARVLEIIAKDGLPGPRDADVAIDAILAACFGGQVPA